MISNRKNEFPLVWTYSRTLVSFWLFVFVVQLLSHVQLLATPWTSTPGRPPCPSPSPGAYSNSCQLTWWCHPTISSSVTPSPPAFSLSQHQSLFQGASSSHQYFGGQSIGSFSFSINLSNEYSGLISFMIDWFDLLAVQVTLKSLLHHHSSKASFNLVYSGNEDLWTEIINLEK